MRTHLIVGHRYGEKVTTEQQNRSVVRFAKLANSLASGTTDEIAAAVPWTDGEQSGHRERPRHGVIAQANRLVQRSGVNAERPASDGAAESVELFHRRLGAGGF